MYVTNTQWEKLVLMQFTLIYRYVSHDACKLILNPPVAFLLVKESQTQRMILLSDSMLSYNVIFLQSDIINS